MFSFFRFWYISFSQDKGWFLFFLCAPSLYLLCAWSFFNCYFPYPPPPPKTKHTHIAVLKYLHVILWTGLKDWKYLMNLKSGIWCRLVSITLLLLTAKYIQCACILYHRESWALCSRYVDGCLFYFFCIASFWPVYLVFGIILYLRSITARKCRRHDAKCGCFILIGPFPSLAFSWPYVFKDQDAALFFFKAFLKKYLFAYTYILL